MRLSRRAALVLLLAYLAVGAFLVFAPSPTVPAAAVDYIYRALATVGLGEWMDSSVVEFVANMALFVPLALFGSVLRPRWGVPVWLVAGCAGSVLVELVQLVLLPGRSATWYDVLANTIGAGLGALLAVPLRDNGRGR